MLRHVIKVCLKTYEQQTVSRVVNGKLYSKRNYTRWAHRRPVAILNEDELFEEDVEEEYKPKKIQAKKESAKKQKKDSATVKTNEKHVDTENGKTFLSYETLKENDNIISSLLIKVKSKKRRKKNDLIFLEGHRLINDCIEAGGKPEVVMFSRLSDFKKLALSNLNVKVYKVPYRTLQLWSNLDTSPGLIALFSTPNVHEKKSDPDAIPITIICDNIREPGNLGSILRAAAGVGCERIILTKGCVELWEPKVLRTAAGAHFRIPISTCDQYEDILSHINPNSRIFMADNNVSFKQIDEPESLTSCVDDSQEECDKSKAMDRAKAEDSNVDDSEVLQESDESRDTEALNVEEKLALLEQKLIATQPFELDLDRLKETFSVKGFVYTGRAKRILKRLTMDLPVVPYFAVDYTKNNVVLIVSGETEGLSFPSLALLHEKQGVRVNVPLTNGVESLNSGVALGIVAFEIKRQFLKKMMN